MRTKSKKPKLDDSVFSSTSTLVLIPELTDKEKETMASALQNPLILHKIFSSLDFPDLKTCRSVHSTWDNISSHKIFKNDLSIIRIDQTPSTSSQTYSSSRISHTLPEFFRLIRKSGVFPCCSYSLQNITLEDKATLQFFQLFSTTPNEIKNLEILSTKKLHRKSKSDSLSPVLSLLNLETFTYDDPWLTLTFLEKISSLKQIPCVQLNKTDLKILEMTGKISIVQEFRCDPETSKFLLRFASLQPKLKIIDFAHLDAYILEWGRDPGYEQILESSKNTLESLVLSSSVQIIPRLEKLTFLKLSSRNCNSRFFPKMIHLNDTFPNVKILDCTAMSTDEEESWTKLFPEDGFQGDFGNVRTVRINQSCTEEWMKRIGKLCPNFTNVVVGESKQRLRRVRYEGSPAVRKFMNVWTHLEGIELNLQSGSEVCKYWMDEIVTGILEEDCERLREMELNDWAMVGEEYAGRGGPPMKNLTELKRFCVRIERKPEIPFSALSKLYLLKFMPDLKLVVEVNSAVFLDSYEMRKFYDELIPYANVKHSKQSG